MSVLLGIWCAMAGGLAALAGLTGMRRAQRLRTGGASAWATTVLARVPADDPDESPGRTMIQYALPDGQLMERIAPQPARKARSLRPGQKVLVWYDPQDPQEVVVFGREGRLSDRVFVAVGVLLVLIGAAIAAFLP